MDLCHCEYLFACGLIFDFNDKQMMAGKSSEPCVVTSITKGTCTAGGCASYAEKPPSMQANTQDLC